jgi:GDP-L-fucose synthase
VKILITGANGFLGKHFKEHYSNEEHKVFSFGRQQLDVTDSKAVEEFFRNNHVDIVLHTAVKGGRRDQLDTLDDFIDNMLMFRNLSKYSGQYGLMINFGSGAEFDRSRQIQNAEEDEIYERWPSDYYGQSKNLITREINKHSNIINLRLFGCFGLHEKKNRMIKGNILKTEQDKDIVIYQNKMMDFFYIKDLCKVVDYIIKDPENFPYKDLNMCYKEKTDLEAVSKIIVNNSLYKKSIRVIIEKDGMGNSYSGCSDKLLSLGVDFIGLESGIAEVYKNLCRAK